MYLKKLFAFLKPRLTRITISLVAMLLVACQDLSVNREKPVFTIAKTHFVMREEITQTNDAQLEIQTEENGLLEVKQSKQVSEPIELEPEMKQALLPETNQTETNLNNAVVTEKTEIAKAFEEASSLPENISEKAVDKNTEQNADLIDNDLKTQGGIPLLPEPLTSNEIASLITMPSSIYAPPPLERIRIGALLSSEGGALRSIMGMPNFVLRNGQMELWQYDVGQCIIDFFLKQSEYDYKVTFIEIRAKMLGDIINEQACESELTPALNS